MNKDDREYMILARRLLQCPTGILITLLFPATLAPKISLIIHYNPSNETMNISRKIQGGNTIHRKKFNYSDELLRDTPTGEIAVERNTTHLT